MDTRLKPVLVYDAVNVGELQAGVTVHLLKRDGIEESNPFNDECLRYLRSHTANMIGRMELLSKITRKVNNQSPNPLALAPKSLS